MDSYAQKKNILASVMEGENGSLRFQPEINKKSKKIDKQNNGDKKRYDMLFEHSKYLLEKKIEQKEKVDIQELEKCTFHPKTNDYVFQDFSEVGQERYEKLYNLNPQKMHKQLMMKSELDQHRIASEISDCTFKPAKLSKVPIRTNQERSFVSEVKGSSEFV